MSRLTGPRVKKMRALLTDLPGLSTKSIERRPYPPGQHGQTRRTVSDFGRQLSEKQKVRLHYGVGEKQLRIAIVEARSSKVATGSRLIELLERRLDNIVFRAGLAPTIPAARQLVRHRHVLVDGKVVDIPSFRTRLGQTISIREKSRHLIDFGHRRASIVANPPEWLTTSREAFSARISTLPSVEDVPFILDVQLVVEFYAQRV